MNDTLENKFNYDKILTISIAAYNVENYLVKALDSCLIKSDDLEVIIINDGSNDKTEEIAKNYEKEYPNIFKYVYKENGGYGSTINKSVELAKGKYFKLLDGDDWFANVALQELVERLKECDSDVVILNSANVLNNGSTVEVNMHTDIQENEEYNICDIESHVLYTIYTMCHKTEIVRKSNLPITENCFYTDTEYLIKVLHQVNTVSYFNLSLYRYRLGINGQSISLEGMRRNAEDAERVLMEVLIETGGSSNLYGVQKLLREIANFAIQCKLCREPNKENKNRLNSFDNMLKEEFPEIYKSIDSKIISILRMSKYSMYRICHHLLCNRLEKRRE